MFEAVWQTYHNKKVDLIFGFVVQFGINFAKMDVKGGKMQNRSICIALPQVQFQHFLSNNQRQLLASHHEWAFKAAALGLFTRVPARISDNTSPFYLRPICVTLPA